MTRFLLEIHGPRGKAEALRVIQAAPMNGTRIEIKGAKRTNDQNAKMWVLLTELSLQLPWGGRLQPTHKWKDLFMDALRAELDQDEDMLPALDGSGRRVNVGNSSSDLSKEEMSMLIELILKFGAEHQVEFGDQARAAA